MQALTSTWSQDEFESVLVSELELLRKSERELQRMYPRLKTRPHLLAPFLEQLEELDQRANRLDAVLNPIGALRLQEPGFVVATAQSSVA